jgi:S-formylglutathione hydrolase
MMRTRHELHDLPTALLGGDPLPYAVLRPEGSTDGLPVLFFLHGGGGSRDFLGQMRPLIEKCWADGTLRPAVVVTPSVERSFYMNYRDGSRCYEDAIVHELLPVVQRGYGTSMDRASTAICGISMGGMGGLRLAFKHPEIFGAVAALEPGIEPVLAYRDIELQDRFYRDDSLYEEIFGSPVDESYWADNNPATIASRDPSRLRDTAILIECGDEDSFNLHRGAEFLHRILWDGGVRHEYHAILGADHLGRTLGPRFEAAIAFIGRALDPLPPDGSLAGFHQVIAGMKRRAGL